MDGVKVSVLEPLNKPMGVAVSPDGHLYIAQIGNNDIVKVGTNLEEPQKALLVGKGLLHGPHAILFLKSGDYYVVDYLACKIYKFGADDQVINVFLDIDKVPRRWMLGGPCSAVLDDQENLIVCNYLSDCLVKFSKDGTPIGWIGRTAKKANAVWSSFFPDETPSCSSENGTFYHPNCITRDEDENIYVADMGNHRIQRFSKDGRFTGWLGQTRSAHAGLGGFVSGWQMEKTADFIPDPSGFTMPAAVEYSDGKLYVAEYGANRIQRFSKDGKFQGWFGATVDLVPTPTWQQEGFALMASKPGCFALVHHMKVYNKSLFVADTYNFRIQKIDGLI